MTKKQTDTNQPQTLSSQIGLLKELIDHPAWKLITAELDIIMGNLKEKLRTPCSDESLKFNASHLLKERLASLFIMKNLPSIILNDLENMFQTESDRAIPIQEKLEKEHKKLSDELSRYIKV
jgi:hypothetical protein